MPPDESQPSRIACGGLACQRSVATGCSGGPWGQDTQAIDSTVSPSSGSLKVLSMERVRIMS